MKWVRRRRRAGAHSRRSWHANRRSENRHRQRLPTDGGGGGGGHCGSSAAEPCGRRRASRGGAGGGRRRGGPPCVLVQPLRHWQAWRRRLPGAAQSRRGAAFRHHRTAAVRTHARQHDNSGPAGGAGEGWRRPHFSDGGSGWHPCRARAGGSRGGHDGLQHAAEAVQRGGVRQRCRLRGGRHGCHDAPAGTRLGTGRPANSSGCRGCRRAATQRAVAQHGLDGSGNDGGGGHGCGVRRAATHRQPSALLRAHQLLCHGAVNEVLPAARRQVVARRIPRHRVRRRHAANHGRQHAHTVTRGYNWSSSGGSSGSGGGSGCGRHQRQRRRSQHSRWRAGCGTLAASAAAGIPIQRAAIVAVLLPAAATAGLARLLPIALYPVVLAQLRSVVDATVTVAVAVAITRRLLPFPTRRRRRRCRRCRRYEWRGDKGTCRPAAAASPPRNIQLYLIVAVIAAVVVRQLAVAARRLPTAAMAGRLAVAATAAATAAHARCN